MFWMLKNPSPSHWDGSFEYPKHTFWMRNKENSFPIRTLIWRPDLCFTKWKLGLYGLRRWNLYVSICCTTCLFLWTFPIHMLMSLGFLPGQRNVVFGDLKRSLCLETCVCNRLPPVVGKNAILSSLINSRDQMKCSIFFRRIKCR